MMRNASALAMLLAGMLSACADGSEGWSGPDTNRAAYPVVTHPSQPLPGFPSASSGSSRPTVYRPERGVVCDQRVEACFKDGVLDKSATRDAFGRDAAHDVAVRRRDGRDDEVYFRTGGKTFCDPARQVCYKNGDLDASATRDAFGNKARKRLNRNRDDLATQEAVFSPNARVSCDAKAQVCTKDGVADARLTRRTFGKAAAGALGGTQ